MKHGRTLIARTGMLLTLAVIALTACGTNQVDKNRGEAFKQYETIVRWSQWDAAADFISVEYQKEHPITRLELNSLRLLKVTTYTGRATGNFDEGMTARQTVEIKMFNKSQGVERNVIDEQEWRYNEETERWKLHSGLPDPTQRY